MKTFIMMLVAYFVILGAAIIFVVSVANKHTHPQPELRKEYTQ
jgi:hypothetical protein